MVDFKRPNCIKSKLPYLKSVHFEYNGLLNRIALPIKSNLKNLLRANGQIRHLITSFHYMHLPFDLEFYFIVSQRLKQLETFHLHDDAELGECALSLESVKKFSLRLNWPNPSFIFRFKQLEEFHFIQMPEIDAKFVHALCENQELKKISLISCDDNFVLSFGSLQRIADLPCLNEFHLRMMSQPLLVSEIEAFCRRCQSLLRLNLEFDSEGCTEYFDELKMKMKSGWCVVRDEQSNRTGMVMFERIGLEQ